MSHKAVDLFPGWYSKGVNKEVPDAELNIRREAITEILEITDKLFWIKMLRVYVGIDKFDSAAYTEVVDQVRKGDSNFIIQNENLVRVLSGCAIAQRIEINDTYLCDFLALSLLTIEITPQFSGVIADLQKLALAFWVNECEERRKLNTNFTFTSKTLQTAIKPELPAMADDLPSVKAHTDAVGKLLVAVQKEVGSIFGEVNKINLALEEVKTNFIALAEETNILWWLFGAYSSLLKKPFNKASPDLLSIAIALELKQQTKSLPGIGGIESIINKALSSVEFEVGSMHSIEQIIGSVREHQESIKPFLPADHKELQSLTPLVFAIRCSTEYASAEWKTVFSKAVQLDLSSKIAYPHCSIQLYKELMLVNLFEKI